MHGSESCRLGSDPPVGLLDDVVDGLGLCEADDTGALLDGFGCTFDGLLVRAAAVGDE
jgi:hypothetical protein